MEQQKIIELINGHSGTITSEILAGEYVADKKKTENIDMYQELLFLSDFAYFDVDLSFKFAKKSYSDYNKQKFRESVINHIFKFVDLEVENMCYEGDFLNKDTKRIQEIAEDFAIKLVRG